MTEKLWHIRIQRRAPYNGGDPQDWRSYREFLAWPKTFASARAAQEFLDSCFTFKGIPGRKLSASVCQCDTTYRNYQGPPRQSDHFIDWIVG